MAAVLTAVGCAIGMATLGAAPAFAVHDIGVFQLEGDAQASTPAGAVGDDWDEVCKAATGGAQCSTAGSLLASNTAAAWQNDGVQNATIFTTGGAKDGQSLTKWQWKDQLGGLPDKDNLQDAFAARYSVPKSVSCPAPAAATNCEVLYFGSDRIDNSGDAQEGFWFFQNKVTLNAANGTFNGLHKDGDLLILSDFSNGGGTSTINIYRWTGDDATGGLTFLTGGATSKCGGSSPDAFCGIVNPTNGTVAPWPFTDKSGNTTYLNGELFEGGVNLSDPSINLGGECFSSFTSETRSSTSVTATLKDFVLGQFALCSATLSTTPSAGTTDATAVSPGQPVTDTAVVQGSGSGAPPTPTGNVTFFLCGPIASPALCTAGTQVSVNALAASAPPPGEATATSSAVNTAANPLLPGRYCFRATWPGDTNYPTPLSHNGTGDSECFLVRQIPTTTVTTPSDSSGTALSSPVALGTNLFDKAVVTGNAVGGSPTGTVAFFICNPTQVSGGAGAEVCAPGAGTALSGNPRTLVAGANNTSSVLSSPAVVANAAGVWCFRATYTPSGTTYLGSSDGTHSECVTVNPDTTTTVTTPTVNGQPISSFVAVNTSVVDHAVVTGTPAGGSPTGTVNFFVCNPTQVAANGGTCSTGGTGAGSVSPLTPGSGNTATADSNAVVANVIGTWCFRAEYVSNTPNYTNSSDSSTGECFVVHDSTSATSSQDWLPNDSGSIASAGGSALNGTLSFTLYSEDNCGATSGAILRPAESFTLTNEASGTNHSTSNGTVKVSTSSTVSWLVSFTSSDPLVSSSSHCEKTQLTITN